MNRSGENSPGNARHTLSRSDSDRAGGGPRRGPAFDVGGHAYQGPRSTLEIGFVGSLLTLVALIFGSLIPAMVIHALVDLGQGLIAWIALRKAQGGGEIAGAVTDSG